jgi:hypothetical protein
VTPASLRVEANGPWSIDFRSILAARTWNRAGGIGGLGDDVLLLAAPPAGPVTALIRNSATQTFAVTAFTPQEGVLLVDEVGNFAGTVTIPDGSVLIAIHAEGVWTIAAR